MAIGAVLWECPQGAGNANAQTTDGPPEAAVVAAFFFSGAWGAAATTARRRCSQRPFFFGAAATNPEARKGMATEAEANAQRWCQLMHPGLDK